MTTPMRAAAGFLGRLFGPASCSLVIGVATIATPVAAVSAAISDEWQFAGWSDSGSGFAMMLGGTAPITARDLRLYAEVLGLDEMQLEIMQDAFEDFDRSYNREWVYFSEARSDAQHSPDSEGDWSVIQKRFTELKSGFDAKVDRMEEQFISDLRLVLTSQQLERWDRLERENRRMKTLAKYASFPDEKIDLVSCVYALDLTPDQMSALEPLLEEYRVQIDSPLVSRNRRAEQLGREYATVQKIQAELGSIEDPMQMQEAYQRFNEAQQALVPSGLELRRACARVREVNNQFRRRIEEQLPSSAIDEFRKIAMPRESSSMMFMGYSRASMMLRMLENLEMVIASAQMQMDMWDDSESEEMSMYMRRMSQVQPLTDQQRTQIDQIREDWETSSAAIRARHASSTPSTDNDPDYIQLPTPDGTLTLARVRSNENTGGFGMMYGRMGMGSSEDPERQREQSKLDQRTVERIRTVLTIEQRALFSMM
ncbi:MAG: hypothetical protein ACNA8P_03685 [Phycisphaerales bacterium]